MADMKCNVCKKKIENLNDYVRIADGTLCKTCWEKAGFGFFAQFGAGNYTSEKIKALIYKKTNPSAGTNVNKKESIKNTTNTKQKVETKTDINTTKKSVSKSGTTVTKNVELKKETNKNVSNTKEAEQKKENKNTVKQFQKQKPTIMEQIDTMEGIEFENYIKKLLEQMGYSSVQTTATTGDQGVDLLAKKGMTKYAIQCKRYKGNVGNKAVQEVFSGAFFYKCDKCMVVTNSHFTNSAKELAKANKVELWDRDKLKELVEKYGKKIK